jgi:hypothetical protein
MFRAEVRNIILSSIAHQSLINRSSIAHQTLIKRSSNAHQTLIFFRVLYALPKSPRVIPVRCAATPRTARARMYYVRYILRAAGPAIGSGGHLATLSMSCRPAARKASCRPTGAREREGSTERNICWALHHLAIAAPDATTSRRSASFW